MDDLISRQTAIDAFGLSEKTRKYGGDHSGYNTILLYEVQDTLEGLPSVQPDISKEYAKAVRTWLVQYQIECAKLEGRYTPYEVLCWIVEDWGKENEI